MLTGAYQYGQDNTKAVSWPIPVVGVVSSVIRVDGRGAEEPGESANIAYRIRVSVPSIGVTEFVTTPSVRRYPAPIEVQPFRVGEYILGVYEPTGIGIGGQFRLMVRELPDFGPCTSEAQSQSPLSSLLALESEIIQQITASTTSQEGLV